MKQIHQKGFTLVEIIVATALFALTISLIMGLFTSTLRINRKVQAIRAAVQGTRNFNEMLAREVRNGRIYYKDTGASSDNCSVNNASNYNGNHTGLTMVTASGDSLCFYLVKDGSKGRLYVKKYISSTSALDPQEITSNNVWVDPDTFSFQVQPGLAPSTSQSSQPRVTIYADFISQASGIADQIIIPYQTTISTDVYDIPKKS